MPTIIVVSTADAGYSKVGAGWGPGTGGYPGGTGPFDFTSEAADTATFTAMLPTPGIWKLGITWNVGSNRSNHVGVVASDGATPILTTTVDMTGTPGDVTYNGSSFKYLSTSLSFSSTAASVVLTSPGTDYTIADAIYFELVSVPPPATRRRGGPGRSLRRLASNFVLPKPGKSAAPRGQGRL